MLTTAIPDNCRLLYPMKYAVRSAVTATAELLYSLFFFISIYERL